MNPFNTRLFSATREKINEFLYARLSNPENPNNGEETHRYHGSTLKQRKRRLSHTNPASHHYANYTKRKRRQKHARKMLAKQRAAAVA